MLHHHCAAPSRRAFNIVTALLVLMVFVEVRARAICFVDREFGPSRSLSSVIMPLSSQAACFTDCHAPLKAFGAAALSHSEFPS